MEKTIVHMDLDTFFVSVERLKDKSLIGMPVIVGGNSVRGVVSGCSYETRRYGVHSGMSILKARKLCPEAIIISGGSELYSLYSKTVTEIIASKAPLFEKASIDEFYIDITGMDKFFGCLKWTKELRNQIIEETGLPISFGMSVNKTVAKIATGESKPLGQLFVPLSEVQNFLNPLPVRKIPGAGPRTCQILNSLGIVTIKDLSICSPDILKLKFGKYGVVLREKANGIDNSPVIPHHERKSISSERTFPIDISDYDVLKDFLTEMTEKLLFKIRKSQTLISCVSVKIKYYDFEVNSLQKHIHVSDSDNEIIPVVHLLFKDLYKRNRKVRLLGVRLSDFVSGAYQLSLFDNDLKYKNLYSAMDNIRSKYGNKSVNRASTYRKFPDKH